MKGLLQYNDNQIEIEWDTSSYMYNKLIKHDSLTGVANNIGGEVFFYQYDLDIEFDGSQKEIFEIGDVVYWRSPKESEKFGILFMYGNTSYGDGTKPRTSSPGIKIGTFKSIEDMSTISSNSSLQLI
ncbi:cyclophilin-like family protein [uncultured Tenacibaculum sp.]|uniref:cyclophilin-like family protein n=1 Tax=uncultured Tenacibaculum sp. TaxID=174713 RepID=UPI002627140F|nr:cyclophilin-like family protein [uncultured Tenacibaculum sp.]